MFISRGPLLANAKWRFPNSAHPSPTGILKFAVRDLKKRKKVFFSKSYLYLVCDSSLEEIPPSLRLFFFLVGFWVRVRVGRPRMSLSTIKRSTYAILLSKVWKYRRTDPTFIPFSWKTVSLKEEEASNQETAACRDQGRNRKFHLDEISHKATLVSPKGLLSHNFNISHVPV